MTTICDSALEALQPLRDGDRLWCHSMAATPNLLLDALAERARGLQDLTLLQLHLEGAEAVADPALRGHLRNRCFFAGSTMRGLIKRDEADYVPIFLSEVPKLLRSGRDRLNAALIQVSPPDRHGNCSLGVSVEATRAAVDAAECVIAHINPAMPRTLGDAIVPLSHIDYAVEAEGKLPLHPPPVIDEKFDAIGRHVASLIVDGDCLQMGIGAIPDAALSHLRNHRDLGIHTEMFSDGVIDLVESGVINNRRKSIHRNKLVTSFALGSQRLYDFIDDNTEVTFLDVEYVNNPSVIRKNSQAVSINSAIQIDLSGQICADSIGPTIYSGVGGQVDFVTGSQLSPGGRSIIAMPATAKHDSVSRLAATLTPGAGVVTTRAHVDYVVTEYGIAALRGRSLRERAQALIAIAHPNFAEELAREYHALTGIVV